MQETERPDPTEREIKMNAQLDTLLTEILRGRPVYTQDQSFAAIKVLIQIGSVSTVLAGALGFALGRRKTRRNESKAALPRTRRRP